MKNLHTVKKIRKKFTAVSVVLVFGNFSFFIGSNVLGKFLIKKKSLKTCLVLVDSRFGKEMVMK